jgi:hypothetical protein
MTCRTTRLGSALTSYTKILEGLEEYQSLSMLHEIIRDAPSRIPPASLADRTEFINEMKAKVAASPSFTQARKQSLEQRLEAAVSENVAPEIFYATKRIETRARVAKVALDDYYTTTARGLGESVGNVRARLRASYEESKRERTLVAPAEWVAEFRRRPGHAGLPMDRHTAYAMWRIDTELAQREGEVLTRPTVTNHRRVHGSGISAVGYDRDTGRLEVEFRSRQGQFYAFQNVPEALAADLTNHSNPTTFFTEQIRGNADYQYPTQEAADAAQTVTNCRTCGQFAGDNHGCPTQDSPEEMAATIERATIQQRVTRARALAAVGTYDERVERYMRLNGEDRDTAADRVDAEDRLAEMSPDTTLRHRQNQRLEATLQPYRGESGTFRATALSTVRRIVDEENRAVVPVRSNITRVRDELTGEVTELPRGIVSGRVVVTPAMGGYTVEAVTTPGDSGEDQLKCTCFTYRANYDCPHVRQTVTDMQQRINQEFLRTPHRLPGAIAEANAAAHAQFEASVAEQATSRAAWEAGGDGVVYSGADGAEVFQRDYKAARDAYARGEMPVEYMTENATDGLGAPGTGRGFGIEMEFILDPNLSYSERAQALSRIGEELAEAGLTTSQWQDHYHAGARNGYSTSHQGGWTFEEDGSVDGEIVSPIMHDTPETWENIAKVTEIVKRNGGTVDKRVGCHVNVSSGNYDHQVENANRLLDHFAKHQDDYYRLATAPGEEHRAVRGSGYCSPNPRPAQGFTDVSTAARANPRPYALNLGHTASGTSRDRVEYRIFDGTLEPAVIQSQIKVALATTEAAFRDTDYQPEGSRPLGTTHTQNRQLRGENRRLTGEQWRESTESLRELTDRLFRRHEDKQQVAAMFAITKASRARSRGW